MDVKSGVAVGTVDTGRPSWEFVVGLVGLKHTARCFKLESAEQAGTDAARNRLVRWFLNSDYLQLLLLDADVVVHQRTLERLASWDIPVVSALCVQRTPPYVPVNYRDHGADRAFRHYIEPTTPGWFENIENWIVKYPGILGGRQGAPVVLQPRPEDALLKVEALGTHCLLVDRDVFVKISLPWFEPGVSFTNKVLELGLDCYVDRSVVVGHEVRHLAGLTDFAVVSSVYRID